MKKIFSIFSLLLLTIFTLSGCNSSNEPEPTMSDTEILIAAEKQLSNTYSNINVYSDITFPSYKVIDEKYMVSLSWSSSNSSYINTTNGRISRSTDNRYCTLYVTLTYNNQNISSYYNATLPARNYINNSPTFNTYTGASEIQIGVRKLQINDDNVLYVELNVFNNLSSKATLKGIKSIERFSIYTSGFSTNYLLQNINYSYPKINQFSCGYHQYTFISFSTNDYNYIDLAKYSFSVKSYGTIEYYAS